MRLQRITKTILLKFKIGIDDNAIKLYGFHIILYFV